jgi:DNA (cytosine-5)-methyltransferase 1
VSITILTTLKMVSSGGVLLTARSALRQKLLTDVDAHTELRCLHLCSGYGGFELGLRLAGVNARTVCHVERDGYAAATLVARMAEKNLDQAPIWDDLTTFDGTAWRGRVDCVTAGFPCQPFSVAGSRLGIDDERWLWPAIRDIIREVGPRFVFLENVPQLVRHGLPYVLSDLANLGFDAEWGMHSASEVGAPHIRERFWLLAETQNSDHFYFIESESNFGRDSGSDAWPPGRDGRWADYVAAGGPEPSVRRSTDGPPEGLVDALHLGGNGLVPAVAGSAFRELFARLKH